jgi:CheY-like chemotaxis protein
MIRPTPDAQAAPLALVADDEPPIRLLCRIHLEQAGFTVVEAARGDDAIRAALAFPPTVALLDVMMPGVGGWAVAERLASTPATRDTHVIFFSASVDDETRARAASFGAPFLAKPFNPAELTAAAEQALERRR